jgi:transposase-like protein
VRPPPRVFPDEVKAQAVARIAAGESVHRVARELRVQPATLRGWRTRLALAVLGADPQKKAEDPDYRELVLAHLRKGLEASERVLDQTRDAGWLKQQSAEGLAHFYGVVFDKIARIVAALPVDEDAQRQLPAPGPDGTEWRSP